MITILLRNDSSDDESHLRVQVDQQVVCDFVQPKSGNLAECLRKAADAVEMSDWVDEVLKSDIRGG